MALKTLIIRYYNIGGNSQKLCCVVEERGSEIIHHDHIILYTFMKLIIGTNPFHYIFCKKKIYQKEGVIILKNLSQPLISYF